MSDHQFIDTPYIQAREQLRRNRAVRTRVFLILILAFRYAPASDSARLATILSSPNPYLVLGIPMNASEAEIRNARKNLARSFHPDLHGNSAEHTRAFANINEAADHLLGKSRSYHGKDFRNGAARSATPTSTNPNSGASERFQQARQARRRAQEHAETQASRPRTCWDILKELIHARWKRP